jgi:hypothetical protein
MTKAHQGKVGIMLNLPEAQAPWRILACLENLFGDPDIIRLPPQHQFLQPFILGSHIHPARPKSAEAYHEVHPAFSPQKTSLFSGVRRSPPPSTAVARIQEST